VLDEVDGVVGRVRQLVEQPMDDRLDALPELLRPPRRERG
jgi:hypothetical protein